MDFKQRQVSNPLGAPRIPEDLRNVRKLTKPELNARIARLIRLTPEQIKSLLENPNTDAFDNILANIIIKAAVFGDQTRLEWLIKMFIPKDQLEGKEADVEDFKREYMRVLDRKKLVSIVKEETAQKANEDV